MGAYKCSLEKWPSMCFNIKTVVFLFLICEANQGASLFSLCRSPSAAFSSDTEHRDDFFSCSIPAVMQHKRGVIPSEECLRATAHCDVTTLYVCEPPHAWDEVGRWDKARGGGGRWALRCDVISWKLLCAVALHPTAQPPTGWGERPHDKEERVGLGKYDVATLYLTACWAICWAPTSTLIYAAL